MNNIPEKPKKPLNAYFQFRTRWMAANKELTGDKGDKNEALKEAWEEFQKTDEKAKMELEYKKAIDKYNKENAEWVEKYGEKVKEKPAKASRSKSVGKDAKPQEKKQQPAPAKKAQQQQEEPVKGKTTKNKEPKEEEKPAQDKPKKSKSKQVSKKQK